MPICNKCSREIRANNFRRHFDVCDGTYFTGPHKPANVNSTNLTCRFCESPRKNKNSLACHERACPKNPNRTYKSKTIGITAWNKGLDKHVDERIALYSAKSAKTRTGKPHTMVWTEERRRAKSEWRKTLHENNPEAHPNRKLANNRNRWTYPERIAADWLDRHGISYEHNKRIGRFYPDFVIGQIIIEIDGERWHDPDKDAKRDSILKSLGYDVYRIKAAEKIEERLSEIFNLGVG